MNYLVKLAQSQSEKAGKDVKTQEIMGKPRKSCRNQKKLDETHKIQENAGKDRI